MSIDELFEIEDELTPPPYKVVTLDYLDGTRHHVGVRVRDDGNCLKGEFRAPSEVRLTPGMLARHGDFIAFLAAVPEGGQ